MSGRLASCCVVTLAVFLPHSALAQEVIIDHLATPSTYDNARSHSGQTFVAVGDSVSGVMFYIGEAAFGGYIDDLAGPAELVLWDVANPDLPVELKRSQVVGPGERIGGLNTLLFDAPVATVAGNSYFIFIATPPTSPLEGYGQGLVLREGSTYAGGAQSYVNCARSWSCSGAHPAGAVLPMSTLGRDTSFAILGTLGPTLTLKAPAVAGCKPVVGRITLPVPAPAGGVRVSLSDTLASASVPAALTIPEGLVTRTFKVTTTPVTVRETGEVRATIGSITLGRALSVRPMSVLSIALSPNPVAGGSVVAGSVKLECNAGPGPVLVEFGSTLADVASATVPQVIVPLGERTALMSVTTSPVAKTTKPRISATANDVTKSKTLTVIP